MKPTIPPADTVSLYLRVPRVEMVYLNGVLETYDDLGVLRTLDAGEGIAVFMASPDLEETARALLGSLAAETGLEQFQPDEADLTLWGEQIYNSGHTGR
jgi:hypothetical protein